MKQWFSRYMGLAILAVIAAGPVGVYAQSPAVRVLLDRAQAQEQSGHLDLAAQSWQQVLLADPNNAEALAGLARWAKLAGNSAEAQKYLDRLRQVNPNDASISRIQGLSSSKAQNLQLQQAARLAQSGHPQEALRIYRDVWSNHPPDGDWALAYYDTQASIPSERDAAVAGLRELNRKYPSDARYAVTLGRILTYGAKTRAEGEHILHEHSEDPAAQSALRQALVWDVQNPNAAPAIREYLKQHKDEELAKDLSDAQARQTAANKGLAQSASESAAFAALSANKVDEAQSRFAAINASQPKNPRALAGLGFVKMKQGDFTGAITYLEQAQQNGLHDKAVESSLVTSRFWNNVQQGTAALNANQFDEAENHYRAALEIRPDAPEALDGLSGAYMKAGQPAEAIAVYKRMVKARPASAPAWRGLFTAQVQASQFSDALATARSLPPSIRDGLAQDPEYLRNLSSAYTATGQDAEGQRVLAEALTLPFPDNGRNMKAGMRLQYAALLVAGKRYEQAAGLYRGILNDDPMNVSAWQGLVSVQHQAGHDADAVATVERMPPTAYESAMQDTGFLSLVAAIYQQQNHFDVAQGFLERAAKIAADKGEAVPIPLQLQIAAIRLQENNPAQAYAIYRSVLLTHPDRLDAWKGLMSALHQTGHDQDALAQMQQIPSDVQRQLGQDPEYLQTVASIYTATGNQPAALQIVGEIQAYYRAQKIAPPAEVEIQSAWLLYNSGADGSSTDNVGVDRDLYRTLMDLGGRTDLTDVQRRRVQTIWASWSVRRAGQAADAGNTHRALQILTAAQQAFPGNPDVTKALASGYLRAGQPRQAMTIYQSPEMADALANPTVSDYQGMVGAALALPNLEQAETWITKAMAAYPNDPAILALAARFEQARGDNARAAAYWKASVAAMPPVSPANQLAHILDRPDIVNPARSMQSSSLAGLLNPDGDGSQARTSPALPSYADSSTNSYVATAQAPPALYGPDPSKTGVAPVPLNATPNAHGSEPSSPASHTTVTTTTTTTYAPPAARRPRPASSVTTGQSATADASSTAAPVHHRRRAASSAGSSADRTITTTHTVTSGGDGSGSSGERLGDYTPQSSLQMPTLPHTRLPDSIPSGDRITAQPRDEARAAADPFAPPLLPEARANEDLASGSELDSGASQRAQLHLGISSANASDAHWDTLALTNPPPPAPQEQPVQLTLDSSPAIQYVPNGSPAVEAYGRASSTLAEAEQPVNAAFLQPQTTSAPQQLTQTYTNPSSSTQYAQQQQLPSQTTQVQQPPPDWTRVKQTVTTTTIVAQNQQGPLTDAPQQQNLPPLRGPWGNRRVVKQRDPREEAEMQLATIEGGFSPWVGGTGYVNHRSGTVGLDQLTVLEAPFEASTPLGGLARLTVVTTPSFLDAGVLDGTSTNRLGTLAVGATSGQQNAAGVGGELQLSTANLGASVGYTPYEFLVSNVTGRFNWRPGGGPLTFSFNRDAVKDSQLSYAGLRDPGSASATFSGNIWGGVIANAANVQFAKGDAKSGLYLGFGGQAITGHHVESNTRIDGVAGAYWHILAVPDTGDLTIGANFFGMHYANNLRYFTYGQGGYFSPSAYLLANVPVTWSGRYGVNLHYMITGAFGLQAFQEEASRFFPLDAGLQAASNNAYYPTQSNVGSNYDLHGEVSYHLTDHWYMGSFVSLNNTRDYNSQSVGFFVRFLGRPQYPTELGPTGLFPYQGNRPLMVP
jgi:tetratricopeptide (TPR) repeat protein